MSKIAKRNFVKKNMDKIHKPKTEESGKTYNRKLKFKRNIPEHYNSVGIGSYIKGEDTI